MLCTYCNSWVPLSSRKPQIQCSTCQNILSKEDLEIQFLINKTRTKLHSRKILTGEDFDRYLIIGNHFFNHSVKFRSKKPLKNYKSPKIVVQKIKPFPCAALDESSAITTQNVYNLHLREELSNKNDLLYYLLAILNSELMTWYYDKQFNLGSKFTNAISIKNLKRLPIKKPNINVDLYLEIVDQVKTLLSTEDKSLINSQIKKINSLVYTLYGWE